MPIPVPTDKENEDAFISRCISEIYNEYGQEQSAGICYSQWRDKDKMSSDNEVSEESQQGGVVPGSMSEEFGRLKFEFKPEYKEPMSTFMSRCMSNPMVKEKKKDRGVRAGFCYSQYQNKYIQNIAKNWK